MIVEIFFFFKIYVFKINPAFEILYYMLLK